MKDSKLSAEDDAQWEQFTTLAHAYCKLVETDAVRGRMGLELIRTALLKLYTVACKLPAVHANDDEPPNSIGHDEGQSMYHRLKHRFKNYDLYWDVFNPLLPSNGDPVAHSLADDLADIWRDLKPGLLATSTASALEIRGARWEWRFGFEHHWGAHAIGGLRAMHYILLQDI